MSKEKISRVLQESEYVALAEFRYQLRRFLRHMEEESRHLGVNPQQYQLVLAIKGLPKGQVPTISCLAERMQLNHNTMVELVDRCAERNMLRRQRSLTDRRQVTLAITPEGEAMLRRLGSAARQELRSIGPMLVKSVQHLTEARSLHSTDNKPRKAVIKKAGS
jgi:DNA-binding MarR family transcriptional regulator